jgi:hypothetical protein
VALVGVAADKARVAVAVSAGAHLPVVAVAVVAADRVVAAGKPDSNRHGLLKKFTF